MYVRMIEPAPDRCSCAAGPVLKPYDFVRAQAKMQPQFSP